MGRRKHISRAKKILPALKQVIHISETDLTRDSFGELVIHVTTEERKKGSPFSPLCPLGSSKKVLEKIKANRSEKESTNSISNLLMRDL
jgi:hypothetical protein